MKVKLIYYILFSIFFILPSFGNETINYEKLLDSTTMPSDEMILKTIKNFNLTQEEEDLVFKETKKRLEETFSTQDTKYLEEGYENLNNQNTSEEFKEENQEEVTEENQEENVEEETHKYSKHPPLTRGHERRMKRNR